jgi:phospholipid-binding lipoprotein MlaA
LRSLYRQQRNTLIRNGAPAPASEIEGESAEFSFDDAVEAASQ